MDKDEKSLITFNIEAINLKKVASLIDQIFTADLSKEEAILLMGVLKEAMDYSRELASTVRALTGQMARIEDKTKTKDGDYSIA